MTAVAVAAEYLEVWRTKDGRSAAFESVYVDENGVTCSELMIWNADGYHSSYTLLGVDMREVRLHWEAAAPGSGAMRIPDTDEGRWRWTNLDPPPGPDTEQGEWVWKDEPT